MIRQSQCRALPFVILWLAMAAQVLADALVVTEAMTAPTIAEIFVEEGIIRVELEIGERDVPVFSNLLPDKAYQRLGHSPRPLTERIEEFLQRDWAIRTGDGEPLPGKMRLIELRKRIIRDQITGEPVPLGDREPEQVLFAEFDYQIPEAPSELTLSAPVSRSAKQSASIGFILYHEGIPLNDFRYLGQEETLDLDWEDPWYSSFRNRNLKRRFSAPAQGFIYVEPFEVRKEILIRVRDLQTWIDLGLKGEKVIPVASQEGLKKRASDFLARHCPMTIDGEPANFELDRVHFIRRSLKQTSVITEPVELSMSSALLGVIFVHRRDGLPQEASMTWDLFSDRITSMRGATHDEAGPLPWTVTPDDPVLKWTNYLTSPTLPTFVTLKPPPSPQQFEIPLISAAFGALGLAGLLVLAKRKSEAPSWVKIGTPIALVMIAALWPLARIPFASPNPKPAAVSDEDATELITGLLRNVYRAFDYRDPDAVYDSLERSVSGDLLSEMYVEVYKVLYLQNQGGAKVKVDAIEMLEAVPETFPDRVGFAVKCQWNVSGKVDHWGHVHTRINQYEATFSVEAVDGKWKITAQDFAAARRLG